LKAILLVIARLLLVAIYSIAVGLFTGYLAMKLYGYFDKRSRIRDCDRQFGRSQAA
jgi:NhaP-type Na+/H+ or K+/H+ antiporter